MRDFGEIEADAKPGAAFSNGTEYDCWYDAVCAQCVHDLNPDTDGGCTLLLFALLAEGTPAEWVPDKAGSLGEQYRCTEFSPRP